MKILVVGSQGSTGRRYCAILKNMGIEVLKYDIVEHDNKFLKPQCDAAIIATPTHRHINDCYSIMLETNCKKILVEKPLSKNIKQIQDFLNSAEDQNVSTHVVCNWAFTVPQKIVAGTHRVYYNYYNHGREIEPLWDMCQLLYMCDPKISKFEYNSTTFNAKIDTQNITLEKIEVSYEKMIQAWLNEYTSMWDIYDAIKMTEKVISRITKKQRSSYGH